MVGLSGGADLNGVPELFIEAKRVERLNFLDAIRQVERNKQKTNSPEIPVVINRRNRMTTGESLCLVRLDDFLKLYSSHLREIGCLANTEMSALPEGETTL